MQDSVSSEGPHVAAPEQDTELQRRGSPWRKVGKVLKHRAVRHLEGPITRLGLRGGFTLALGDTHMLLPVQLSAGCGSQRSSACFGSQVSTV